jgi:hypothetical protein
MNQHEKFGDYETLRAGGQCMRAEVHGGDRAEKSDFSLARVLGFVSSD